MEVSATHLREIRVLISIEQTCMNMIQVSDA